MKHDRKRAGHMAVLMEPHPLCHAAITSLLARCDADVVGAATTASEALTLLEQHAPNVLVAELDLPEGREAALDVISTGRRADPALTVIVLSGCDDSDLIDEALTAGASAYIVKTASPDAVATDVRQALEPSVRLARPQHGSASTRTSTRATPQLTRRELEILKLVSEGRSNRQVGQLLWVTDQTVKFHLANIYRKLGVGSRHDAARWAQEHGVIDLPAPEAAPVQEVGSAPVLTLEDGNRNGNGHGEADATPVRLRRASRALAARGSIRGRTSQ
jgi:DNA-binding NarL/FixJ family response regulator